MENHPREKEERGLEILNNSIKRPPSESFTISGNI